jgi:predicted DNA-binding protein with PD1-like motif
VNTSGWRTLPLRLEPDADLRAALERVLEREGCEAAFVTAGIGSLGRARIRYAGSAAPATLEGDFEILTLAGSLARDGAHLHIAVADASGRVMGGHVAHGCVVRTTAEILVVLLPDWSFARVPDTLTGYDELVVRASGESRSDAADADGGPADG